jgi:hypothetical protein
LNQIKLQWRSYGSTGRREGAAAAMDDLEGKHEVKADQRVSVSAAARFD